MNLKTSLTSAAIVAVLGLTLAPTAHADLQAIAITGDTAGSTNVTFTGTNAPASAGLTIGSATSFIQSKTGAGYDGNATVTFQPAPLPDSSYSFNASTGQFDQLLGTTTSVFSFKVTDNTTNALLLSGTFGQGDLHGKNGASSGNVDLTANSVTYTGGSFFNSALFSPNNGSLSIEFTSQGNFVADASGLAAFKATDGITYSAQTLPSGVPEPTTVASFGLGGFGLLGLMLRARKARKTVA